jgi:hypothetical protein
VPPPPPYPDRPIQFRHHDRRIPLPQPPATAAARYAAARYRSREILAAPAASLLAPAASLLAPATCAQPSTQRAARSRTNPRLLPRASRSRQPAPAHQRANAPATCAHLPATCAHPPATCAHPPATPPPRSAQPPLPPSPRRAAASAPAFFPAQRAAAPNPAQPQPPRAQPARAQPPPTPRNAARRRSRHARSRLHPNNHARSSPPHAHV